MPQSWDESSSSTTVHGPISDVPAGGTGTAAGGYDTAPNRDALIAAVNEILTALRAANIIASP